MWRVEKGQLSFPCAGLAGASQSKTEHKSGLKTQKGTQSFGPESKVILFIACFKLTRNKSLLSAWPSIVP